MRNRDDGASFSDYQADTRAQGLPSFQAPPIFLREERDPPSGAESATFFAVFLFPPATEIQVVAVLFFPPNEW